jgi:NADH-quinone oxidoreductase subunit H
MDSIYNLLNLIPPWAYIAVVMPMMVMLPTVGLLTLLERKVASWAQDRVGPNRAAYPLPFIPKPLKKVFQVLQVMADGLKFFVKEDFRAKGVDRILFSLAPALMLVIVMVAVAIIPWAGTKGRIDTTVVKAGQVPEAVIDAALPRWHSVIGTPTVSPAAANFRLDQAVASDVSVTYLHGWRAQVATLDIGVLFAVSVLSLAVYGVVIGGWASNNKYSFLGGLRATANMISYEIPLGVCILCVVTLFGTLDLGAIVERQTHYWLGVIPAWNAFSNPAVFLIFLVCLHAESNRAPFDIAEAEQELVGGYHTEYSSMRFALFFLAEYFEMLVTSSICVALFFGGWHVPYLDKVWPALSGSVDKAHPGVTESYLALLVQGACFYGKVLVVIFVFMWTRWSLPRFRFDQILHIAWQALIPLSLALLALNAVVLWAFGTIERINGGILPARMGLALLAGNLVVMGAAVVLGKVTRTGVPTPNKRVRIAGSRFNNTPLPAGVAKSV